MFHRRARPGVGADADAEGVDLQRRFAQPHLHGSIVGKGRVGVQRDADGFEEAGLLQPFLEVQQQCFRHWRAAPGVGQVAHGFGVLHRQALDLELAQPEQRAAVHHQEQPHLVALDIDIGAGAAPGGQRIARGAQPCQCGGLGRVPGGVAEVAALGQFPVLAQRRQRGAGIEVVAAGGAFQRAFGFQRDARNARTAAGVHRQRDEIRQVAAAAGRARHADLGIEVAFGLQQFFHLGR